MSLSDGGIQPTMNVSPSGSSGGWGGFGGDGGWWFIILFLALFCGWGGNGFGNNRGNSGGVVDGYVLASDFANIERKMDLINGGLCDGFYAVNNSYLRGSVMRSFPLQPAGSLDAADEQHGDAGTGVLL